MPGLILSAPASGAGKTTVTLGLLHALRLRGITTQPAKSGPDYIDPRFHEAASGTPCLNLDAWAMTPNRLRSLAQTDKTLVVEGAMGLFDGALPDGRGATADLARHLGLPVVLVIDAGKMAQSAAAIVRGFAGHDAAVRVAGVVLNNVGSDKHARMLQAALAPLDIPILGTLPRSPDLVHPSRHLGLVQASEREDLDSFLAKASKLIEAHLDVDALLALAKPQSSAMTHPRMSPPAQCIAVARDTAFAFTYPHMLADWRAAGAEILTFSPLNDDPAPEADFIFLPGGYPELHAGRLASNTRFLNSLRATAAQIYGECGGYMTLGTGLIDADGNRHVMAGLLPLETSFADRKRHLGYRHISASQGPMAGAWTAHEFHYATTLSAKGDPLFAATDAEGLELSPMGLIRNNVSGSFAHIIDRA